VTNAKNTGKTRATVTTAEPAVACNAKATRPAAGASAKPKPKRVRDSLTIPKSEYAVLEGLKARAANLRAGIAVLNAMADKAFLAAPNRVPSSMTGRPKGWDATSTSGTGSK